VFFVELNLPVTARISFVHIFLSSSSPSVLAVYRQILSIPGHLRMTIICTLQLMTGRYG
jgi:hypothetical protein